MEYLKILKKDKFGMFAFSIFTAILVILFLKNSLITVYNYFVFGDDGLWVGDFGQSLIILIFGLPTIIMFDLPKIFEYIGILVDIKNSELITKTVVSISKPVVVSFDKNKLVTKEENKSYYVWKVKNEKGKKMKMICFENVFSFVGKTIGHTYEVTYYKHSKVIVDVKKIS